jgi:pyruvate formate lyase activating enzyme
MERPVTEGWAAAAPSLEAKNPFELRVDLGKDVPEKTVRDALADGDMGFLHSFTTGSTVDGPGVRVVAWTTGCMWRCQYCHNPDTWTMRNGYPVSLARAIDEVRKYRQGLKVMGGGFTISGGDPLMQHRFVANLLKGVKAAGIHTCIETNGYKGAELSDADLESIDLVMLGMKSWGEERHKQLTGREHAPTLDFARRLAALKKPVWVRFVLVPGLTDDPEMVKGIAQFVAGLGNVERVEVLPFHQLGRYKWERLGLAYACANIGAPAADLVDRTIGIFRSAGLKAC